MGIEQLEKKEVVSLYWIQESQAVVELDSPSIGSEQTIAKKESVYEFFHSQDEAQQKIGELKEKYKSHKHFKFNDTNYGLEGRAFHEYANAYEVRLTIKSKELPVDELGADITDLLDSPQRKITHDHTKDVTRRSRLRSDKTYSFDLL